jgi:energy-coupling factor transporter ATP-binding protein EcfA2
VALALCFQNQFFASTKTYPLYIVLVLIMSEFTIMWSRSPGLDMASDDGIAIAARPGVGRLPTAYINLRKQTDGVTSLDNIKSAAAMEVEPRHDMVNRLLIAGPSGAGKSTLAGKWLNALQAESPEDRDIYLLSRVAADGALDDIPKLQRIPLDDEFAEAEPYTSDEFEDAVVIFDDTDTITNKAVRTAVTDLRDDILETGRHKRVDSIVITHQMFQGAASKKPLGEATGVVLFPQTGSKYHIKRYLREYAGFDLETMKRIMAVPSRWVYIQRTHPCYVIHERGCFLV